jgi:hypothetical protein
MGALPWHLNRIAAVRVTSFVFPGSSAPKLIVAGPDLNLQLFFEMTVAATVRVPVPAEALGIPKVVRMNARQATANKYLKALPPFLTSERCCSMSRILLSIDRDLGL